MSLKKKPLILITNDDGSSAPGLLALIEVMKTLGDVIVVAPDSPQSGMGHAVTINSTLHFNKINILGGGHEYSCSGTPADCVKLANTELLKGKKKPDLCVSGINHGSNSSINVIYSGTVGAAVEAGIAGIPAIGFSFLDYSWEANFEEIKPFVRKIAKIVLQNKMPKDIVFNVNIPKLAENKIKGIKICSQAKAFWNEKFDKRINPMGQEYYWLTGDFLVQDNRADTDEKALKDGYISIVPIQFDFTAYSAIKEIKKWKFDE